MTTEALIAEDQIDLVTAGPPITSTIASETGEPWNARGPLSAKFSPKFADWFELDGLTNTHKRIAYGFGDILQTHTPSITKDTRNLQSDKVDDPSAAHPLEDLASQSLISGYNIGTGDDLTNLQCGELITAEHEVILVTGFLHPKSASVRTLHRTLEILATRQTMKNVRRGSDDVLKVHICFSSSGLSQKLFHTTSKKGRIWKPKEWKKLGIADPKYLSGRVDLTVKSLFFRPVGLLHGKYMIVDRKTLVIPSANLSWEEWLEGGMTYVKEGSGTCIVRQFVRFWESVWQFGEEPGQDSFPSRTNSYQIRDYEGGGGIILDKPKGTALSPRTFSGLAPTVFLPHPYQQSLPPVWPLATLPEMIWRLIRQLSGSVFTLPPVDETRYLSNPQNAFIMAALDGAQKSIYLHTPNVTAKPILNAIIRAVKRGVVVEIVTSMIMMKWEQLVTAGTTTEKCLIKMVDEVTKFKASPPPGAITTGALFIYQYNPTKRPQLPPFFKAPENNYLLKWYDKSHVKCLIVDEEVVMLGSGNADRASWVTSQEINVGLFLPKEKTQMIRQGLVDALAGRLEVVKGSTWVKGGAEAKDEEGHGVDVVPRKRMGDPEA